MSDEDFAFEVYVYNMISRGNEKELSKCIKEDTFFNPNWTISVLGLYPSLLMIATRYKQLDIMKILLENGAEVNHKNRSGQNCIFTACEHSYEEALPLLELLIKHGCDTKMVNKANHDVIYYLSREKNTEQLIEYIKSKQEQ